MAPITNQHLQEMIQKLTVRVDRIEERMKTYEEQFKMNTTILERVEETVNGYQKTLKTLATLFKWVIGVIGIATASVLAYWVMGALHIHP